MAKIERFDAINQQLLSVVDAQILEVNDAMNTLACMLLDSISELSYDDADFVIDVVEQYLGQIPSDEERMAALHAKVISVDQQQTLITSANLSYHGQQGNIELGTLIESKRIAKQIDDMFTKLIFSKVFSEV